jgi:hypothetical protein
VTAEESLSKKKVKEEDVKDININPRMLKKCKQVLPAQQKAGDEDCDGFEPPDTDSSESSQKSPPPLSSW